MSELGNLLKSTREEQKKTIQLFILCQKMIIIFIYIANCIESCYVVLYEHKVVAG